MVRGGGLLVSALVILLTFGIMARAGWHGPCSAMAGMLVVMGAEWLFTHYAFRYQGAKDAAKILVSFFKGEALRILFLALGTVLALSIPHVEPRAYLVGWVIFIVVSTVMRTRKTPSAGRWPRKTRQVPPVLSR